MEHSFSDGLVYGDDFGHSRFWGILDHDPCRLAYYRYQEGHLKLHHPILDIHRKFALLTMGGSLMTLPILWLMYKKNKTMFRVAFFICAFAIVTFVLITAYNGGRMVYEYGVGVEQ